MSRKEELLRRIESLKLVRSVLDGEIGKAKEELAGIDAGENEYARQRQTRKLAEFFYGLGFLILHCETKTEVHSDPFYRIALNIWNFRQEAWPFFRELFKADVEGREFDWTVSSLTSAEGVGLLNLCNRMKSEKLLDFTRTGDTLHVVPEFPKERRNFLNGGWAEEVNRYLAQKTLQEFARRRKLKYKIFWDIRLRSVDSERNVPDMQLDLVLQLGGRFYVIETKSGVPGIQKWVERAALFERDGNRYLTCCAAPGADHRFFRPYRLFSFEKLEEQLTAMLERDFPPAAEA